MDAELGAALADAMAGATFADYAVEFLTIEDENGKLVPLELNDPQEIIYAEVKRQQAAGRPVRLLILKGRQQGASTFCQAYLAWMMLTRPGTRTITIGHTLAAVHDLFGKLNRINLGLGDIEKKRFAGQIKLQPEQAPGGEFGRRMVFADPLRSMARYDSAQEPEKVGRAGTFQAAHLTEVPQWAKPAETMQAVLATISNNADTVIFVETTAKGMSDWFYETWIESMRKVEKGIEPNFVPVFVPWFKTKRYARKRRPGEPGLTPGERKQLAEFDLQPEQLYWYRDQIEQYGERVSEEFPFTWQEAFLSAGLKFFLPQHLEAYEKGCRTPQKVGRHRVVGKTAKWEESFGGPTCVFAQPDPDHDYVIGVDFASGRANDRSAIVVVDVDAREVVCTHVSKDLPDEIVDQAMVLGMLYNKALIIPERSGIGQPLCDRLAERYQGSVYIDSAEPANIRQKQGTKWGWATSNASRPWLLEELAAAVHNRSLAIPDERIVDEMKRFVYSDDAGKKAEAEPGANDDLIFALAIALRGFKARPIKSQKAATQTYKRRPSVSSATGY